MSAAEDGPRKPARPMPFTCCLGHVPSTAIVSCAPARASPRSTHRHATCRACASCSLDRHRGSNEWTTTHRNAMTLCDMTSMTSRPASRHSTGTYSASQHRPSPAATHASTSSRSTTAAPLWRTTRCLLDQSPPPTRPPAPARARRGVPPRPIPVVVLGRLAIDDRHQHSGLGRALLRDSMLRVLTAAEHVGVRALLVHAKNDDVRDWYLKQAEFEAFPGDPASLMLLMKDLRRSVGSQPQQEPARSATSTHHHISAGHTRARDRTRTCTPLRAPGPKPGVSPIPPLARRPLTCMFACDRRVRCGRCQPTANGGVKSATEDHPRQRVRLRLVRRREDVRVRVEGDPDGRVPEPL